MLGLLRLPCMGRVAVRIAVDADRCTGHGRCYSIAPELLTSDDEGFVTIRGSATDVPADLLETARQIESSCPEGAVRLLRSRRG